MVRLSKGGNVPLPAGPFSVQVRCGSPVEVSALLLGPDGRVRTDADPVFSHRSPCPGVTYVPSPQHGPGAHSVRVDTGALPADVSAVVVTASLDGTSAASFGLAGQTTVSLVDGSGTEAVRFEVSGLGPETALVCVELYRRGEAWKLRAVGQGYASGLAGIATDFGAQVDETPPAAAPITPPPSPARSADTAHDSTAPPVVDLRAALRQDAPAASATLPPQLDLRAGLTTAGTDRVANPLPALDMRDALTPPTAAPPPTGTAPPAVDLRGALNLDQGTVTLRKNETVNLVRAGTTSLDRITMGLGWAPASYGRDIDLDASVVAVAEDGSLVDVVWFHNLMGCRGAIRHGGDNVVGSHGGGDDECIYVDLGVLPPTLKYLVFTVTSYTGQRFTEVREAYCRLLNGIGPHAEELVRFTLSGNAPRTAALMCKMVRTGGIWQMTAIGTFHEGRTVLDLGEALDQELS